jgi:hypothetical protein
LDLSYPPQSVPTKICFQKLQKHLNECTGDGKGNHKCTRNYLSHYCQFNVKENGRCSHFYQIEGAVDELTEYSCYFEKCKERIDELENKYKEAKAVKEDRLEYYLDELDDY